MGVLLCCALSYRGRRNKNKSSEADAIITTTPTPTTENAEVDRREIGARAEEEATRADIHAAADDRGEGPRGERDRETDEEEDMPRKGGGRKRGGGGGGSKRDIRESSLSSSFISKFRSKSKSPRSAERNNKDAHSDSPNNKSEDTAVGSSVEKENQPTDIAAVVDTSTKAGIANDVEKNIAEDGDAETQLAQKDAADSGDKNASVQKAKPKPVRQDTSESLISRDSVAELEAEAGALLEKAEKETMATQGTLS
jgi:hypothetical protein